MNKPGVFINYRLFTQKFSGLFVILFLFLSVQNSPGQVQNDSINKKRLHAVIIGSSAAYATSLVVLYYAWYKDAPKTSFHFIDDSHYWLQIDKCGHATTAYTLSDYGYWSLRWSGVDEKKSTLYGGLMGWTSMTVIEILDGFSADYGASWADLAANTVGTALFIGQQLLWKEQRFRLKWSYHPTDYAQYNPDQLGKTGMQRILKDYNGHTYWLSMNIHSFLKEDSRFPGWINVAVGYGGKGMLSGPSNPPGDVEFDRVRQYYLTADIDWTKIKTNSGFLKFTFKLLSFIKLPFPALEYNKQNGMVWHWLYF